MKNIAKFCLKVFQLLFVLLKIVHSSEAATNVPAGNVSGNWTLAGSPYNIQGDIQVPVDSLLSIEPGVAVVFQGSYLLRVFGSVNAVGTMSDTISFTSADTTNGFRGIRFDSTASTQDSSLFIFCSITYSKVTAAPLNILKNGGAFIFFKFSKARISNSRISNCSAYGGGAVYLYSSSTFFSNNIISYNNASTAGGAFYCTDTSNAVITGNTIINNTANSYGGIACNSYSNAYISDNIITMNACLAGAGGISCNNSNPIIYNNTITYNYGPSVGGIYITLCNPAITHNTISNNTGIGILCNSSGNPLILFNTIAYNQNGITCQNTSSPQIINNIISNNTSAVSGGGGILSTSNSSPEIIGNLICNNTYTSVTGGGGGIHHQSYTSINIFNNTIVNNQSYADGGGVYITTSTKQTVRNCIVYGNVNVTGSNQFFVSSNSSTPAGIDFFNCDIEGGLNAFTSIGTVGPIIYQSCIDTIPYFISPSSGAGNAIDGLSADWSLDSNSTCINAGDTGSYTATDVAGNPRVIGVSIDIGAYEYQQIISGMQNMNDNAGIIRIYPNPIVSSFFASLSHSISETIYVTLCNTLKQAVKQATLEKGQTSMVVDIDNLPSGLYSLSFRGNGWVKTAKVIKFN